MKNLEPTIAKKLAEKKNRRPRIQITMDENLVRILKKAAHDGKHKFSRLLEGAVMAGLDSAKVMQTLAAVTDGTLVLVWKWYEKCVSEELRKRYEEADKIGVEPGEVRFSVLPQCFDDGRCEVALLADDEELDKFELPVGCGVLMEPFAEVFEKFTAERYGVKASGTAVQFTPKRDLEPRISPIRAEKC